MGAAKAVAGSKLSPYYFSDSIAILSVADSNRLPTLSGPAFTAALLTGAVFSVTVHWYAYTIGYTNLKSASIALLIPFTTLTIAGTVPAFAFFRSRLVAPLAVLAVAVNRWIEHEPAPGPGDPFVGLLAVIPLYLVLMIVAGWGERRMRATVVDRIAATE